MWPQDVWRAAALRFTGMAARHIHLLRAGKP